MFQKSVRSLFVVFALLVSGYSAHAKIQEFKVKEGEFKLDLPPQWDHAEALLGIPVTLVSPLGAGGQRAVISITPYGVIDKDDVLKKIKKDPEEYVKQKEDWLENVDGESLSYDSFHEETENGSTIYSIGMSYKVEAGTYHEQTFFVSDKTKHIYFVTALVPQQLDAQTNTIVKAVTRSIASVK